MKHRFFAFFIVFTFVLNATGAAFADTKQVKTQNALLALLPASDAVVALDAKRFFNVALPQILSGNKEMMDEVNGKIDDFKAKTSIDIRQFEQILTINKVYQLLYRRANTISIVTLCNSGTDGCLPAGFFKLKKRPPFQAASLMTK